MRKPKKLLIVICVISCLVLTACDMLNNLDLSDEKTNPESSLREEIVDVEKLVTDLYEESNMGFDLVYTVKHSSHDKKEFCLVDFDRCVKTIVTRNYTHRTANLSSYSVVTWDITDSIEEYKNKKGVDNLSKYVESLKELLDSSSVERKYECLFPQN